MNILIAVTSPVINCAAYTQVDMAESRDMLVAP